MKDQCLIFIITGILSICSANIFAQGQGNSWYFGNKAGISFNASQPVPLSNGELDTFEGCASISSPQGELLFYTDGVTVWNRNHDTLANGTGLRGGQSTTQAALIIPKPGSTHLYYIFTASEAQISSNWSLCYSELDMNLDGGLGGITTSKNVLLFTPIGEKITGIKHANNTDIWVISHDKFTNKYLTYLVTSVGVNNTPLIFAGGTTDNGTSFPNLTSPNFGYMKASPDGNRIACAFSAKSRIDILNFDRATGQISFRFTLTQIPNAYGLEFSPNGKLLYATGYTGKNIRQYNLSLNTLTQVVAASVILRPRTHLNVWALQLGPDEKIYASRLGSGFLDCILHPNNVGTTCNFVEEAIYLDGKFASAGLPNFFPYFMQPSGITDRGFCPLDTTFFSIEAGLPPDSVKWNFGDPASGALNFSTSLSPYHVYQQGGTYPVTVLKFNGSVVDTLEKPVTILPQPYVNLGPDTTFCEGTSIELNAFAGSGYTYSWGSPTAIYPNITIVNQGPYAVTVSNSCGAWSDTIVAWKVNPPVPFSLGTDIEVCEGTLVQLNAAQANTKTIWQDGTFGPAFFPTTSGTYIAEVRNVCSSVKDTINVSFNPLPTVSLGPDVSFCNGDSVWIKPTGMADTYLWSTGSTADSITVSAAGVIYVRATNTCGTASDTLTARQIFSPQPVNLGPSNTLCENQVLILNAFQQGVSYTWQDGSTNPEFSVSDSGIYYVRVTNPCGTSSDTVFIQKIPNPSVTLGPDIQSCEGKPIPLFADGVANDYLWQDGSDSSGFLASGSGFYWVSVFNTCGTASDSIRVKIGKKTYDTLDRMECEPFTVNGIRYASSGTFSQTLVNSTECDSLLTVRVEIVYRNISVVQTDSTLFYPGLPTSIQWMDCSTGAPVEGANQTLFKPLTTGYYRAIVKTGKCVDSSTCQFGAVRLKPVPPVTRCEDLVIAPNPTAGLISVTLDKPQYTIRIYSLTGALVMERSAGKAREILNFKELAAALYLLEVDGCRYKVVKQ